MGRRTTSEPEPQPVPPTFGRRIQQLRRLKGFTQRALAGVLGIDFTYLSKLENDRGDPPSEDLIRKMAGQLDSDADELLALAGKISPDLRRRAVEDAQFAMLLRKLPNLSADKLTKLYREAGVSQDEADT